MTEPDCRAWSNRKDQELTARFLFGTTPGAPAQERSEPDVRGTEPAADQAAHHCLGDAHPERPHRVLCPSRLCQPGPAGYGWACARHERPISAFVSPEAHHTCMSEGKSGCERLEQLAQGTIFLFAGTPNEFRKNYELPILRGRDALATDAEQEKGQQQLNEVWRFPCLVVEFGSTPLIGTCRDARHGVNHVFSPSTPRSWHPSSTSSSSGVHVCVLCQRGCSVHCCFTLSVRCIGIVVTSPHLVANSPTPHSRHQQEVPPQQRYSFRGESLCCRAEFTALWISAFLNWQLSIP